MAEDSSEYWETIVARLTAERAALAAQDAAVEGRTQPLALNAALGDAKAGKAVAVLNDQRAAIYRTGNNLDAAIKDAAERLVAAQQAEAAVVAAARAGKAREAARAILAADGEIDSLLRSAAEAFARRREAILSLRPLGQLDVSRTKKLGSALMMLAAMRNAGLGDFLPIDRVPQQHIQSITSWDTKLLGGLLGETPAPNPDHEDEAAPVAAAAA